MPVSTILKFDYEDPKVAVNQRLLLTLIVTVGYEDIFSVTSDNPSVVEVGMHSSTTPYIIGKRLGTAKITVRSNRSNLTDTCIITVVSTPTFSGGNGTESDPYLIATPEDLDAVRFNLSAHFRQTADINLSVFPEWLPIGFGGNHFTGDYDGNSFTVSNMRITSENEDYVGLFYSLNIGKIRNVNLIDSAVIGRNWTALLVGQINYATLYNCHVSGTVNAQQYIGGLSGVVFQASVSKCSCNADFIGHSRIGSLFGNVGSLELRDCFAKGNISSLKPGGRVGGLVGMLGNRSSVKNCYAACSMSLFDTTDTGGLIGQNQYLDNSIINSYYDSQVSGLSDSGKGEPRSTYLMKRLSTYIGWDFNIWKINEGQDYPWLLLIPERARCKSYPFPLKFKMMTVEER